MMRYIRDYDTEVLRYRLACDAQSGNSADSRSDAYNVFYCAQSQYSPVASI